MNDDETNQAQCYQQEIEDREQWEERLTNDLGYLKWLDQLNKQTESGYKSTTTTQQEVVKWI